MIIEDTYDLLKRQHPEMPEVSIDNVCVGQYLTAVRLSNGGVGVASSLEDEHPFCSKKERDFGDFTPLNIKGKTLKSLFETEKNSKLIFSLRIAALNAVSSFLIDSGKYRVIEDRDPLDLVDLGKSRTITVVGAFQTYITRLAETSNRLYVLEFNENSFKPEHKKYYVNASEYRKIIPESDVVVITGQTLVNNTLEGLLKVTRKGSEVIVTGPSGSMIPDILFGLGVSIIGGMRITDPDLAFNVVSQAGMGYHLFRYCARKICITQ
ncbi:MAG TPA: DUF364 domain-containing protein [Bacteroidales bacterium]|nr:DUF364 domain-containing protein [Bacteroidales bacterium]